MNGSAPRPSDTRAEPAVGALAPDFALPDPIRGDVLQLSSLRGRDVILVFFRGTWCPYCRTQMQTLSAADPALRAAGVSPVGVVCQSAASIRRHLLAEPQAFPLLADESRSVARAYRVYYRLSLEGFHLARPSLFVIDRAGLITFAYRGTGMSDLPVADILGRLVALLRPGDRTSDTSPVPPYTP